MNRSLKYLALGVALATAGVFGNIGGATTARAVTDLGFALDISGSIGSSDWGLETSGLANALSVIPTDGSYRIGVVSFGSSANTIVAPTIINSAADITTIQGLITGTVYTGGGTCMSCGIDQIVSDFGALSATSLINISTDGFPNSDVATAASAVAAQGAGWDGLSAEAIGAGADTTFLASIAFPTPVVTNGTIPDPRVHGFVLPVANFGDYGPAIASKVQAVVGPPGETPLPAALPLFVSGLGGLGGLLGWRKRRKKSVAAVAAA